MKLALAQLNTTVGDLTGNLAKIRDAYRRAVAAGADLVLTPELAITGYPPRDLLVKRRFIADNLHALDELTKTVGDTALVVGYVDINPHRPGRECFNAAALIERGAIVARRYKTLLPTYDVFDEDRYFQPASSNEPLTWRGQRIGLTICEDIWSAQEKWSLHRYPRDPVRELGALDCLLNISASPFHLGKERLRREMLQAVARDYRFVLAYCNQVGGNDELVFDGHSIVLDASGRILAEASGFREDLLVVDLASAMPVPPREVPEIELLYDALVLGLRDYVQKCGFRSVVLGLSGGIDSAVTACLAVEALGAANVTGVSMPSQFSSKGSIEDARQLAENLGIRWLMVPIQDAFESVKRALAPVFAGLPEDITEENIQARLRGILLMALSNKFGHLLLTTGNKSELAVGYCTLYGDMAGGLAVIADVPKTRVYELARYINRHRTIIPPACLTKPPSAELRPNQTDQDTLPPYEVLDAILTRYVEETKSAAEIVGETGFDEKLVREIVRKIDLNEYKRKQAPPCLRVTTKAFGIGRRVPIAQRYVER
ncbi:MAG: NAD+ synthase [Verrucomicrobiae bacterium]|nr:NAD+ synthase [Verrucomicrobiae bacterium]